jgi:hypothetical protein
MVSTSRRNPFEELHHSLFLTFDEKRHYVIVFFFHGSFFGICKKRNRTSFLALPKVLCSV